MADRYPPPGPELRARLMAEGRNYGLDAFTPEERAEMDADEAQIQKIVAEMIADADRSSQSPSSD